MVKNCLPLLRTVQRFCPYPSTNRYLDGNGPLSEGTQSHRCDLSIVTPILFHLQNRSIAWVQIQFTVQPKKDETSPKPSEKHT